MVHPRQTRNRPLLRLRQKGYHIFTNNINGSPGYLHRCLLPVDRELSEPLTDAVSCHCLVPINIVNIKVGSREIALKSFLVQFWDSDASQSIPVISLEVYGPSSWTPQKFLHEFNDNLATHGVISLIYTLLY
jgi:hypothetical protein